MEKQVKIYALIDPITLKVRYIGRTTSSLKKRLSEHISKAKHCNNYTHKENWIRSLLKINSKPYIRCLTTINGWQESYKFECELIRKYKDRLVNDYDKGPGYMRDMTEQQKLKISKTLKQRYKEGLHNPARKIVYAYNKDGSFYKEFISIRQAAKELGYYFKVISKQLNSGKDLKHMKKDYQFSFVKVEKMKDFTKK